MKELVSVIVPVHNVAPYLDRCLQSIVEQTYEELEILLMENGSTDASPQMCDAWAKADSRIKAVHTGPGQGVSEARNLGMRFASGSLWMFVDSDDYLSRDAVEVLYERMRSDGSDIAIGRHLHAYEDGTAKDRKCRWMKNGVLSPEDILREAERDYPVCLWGKLFRRSLWKKLVLPPLVCGEDLWVFPQLISRAARISLVEHSVYYYFQRPGSAMRQKSEDRKRDEFSATLHMAKFVLDRGYLPAARKWLARAIRQGMELRDRKTARRLWEENFTLFQIRQLVPELKPKLVLCLASFYIPGMFTAIRRMTGRASGA